MSVEDRERGLARPAEMLLDGMLDATELQTATQKLYALLGKRVARYTMGDHSSVPVDVAEELLRSIAFTLAQVGCTGRALAQADLDEAFMRGQDAIQRMLAATKRLYFTVRMGAPRYESRALADTLISIGGFFERYDVENFAHSVPCDVDYQLCRPVDEGQQGVAYISAYLHALKNEHAFLRRFAPDVVTRLLTACYGDYAERINNLCEPVVVNALGCALLGRDVRALLLPGAEQAALVQMLEPLTKEEMRRALSGAAETLFQELDIRDDGMREDVAWVAWELCPRIRAALPTHTLDGIFLA